MLLYWNVNAVASGNVAPMRGSKYVLGSTFLWCPLALCWYGIGIPVFYQELVELEHLRIPLHDIFGADDAPP